MDKVRLDFQIRTDVGKGPSRQLRAQKRVPAVLFGLHMDNLLLSIDAAELNNAIALGRNAVFELDDGKDTQLAMIKELSIHPVTRKVIHGDFYRVTPDLVVKVDVPLHTDGRSKGVVKGGILHLVRRSLPLKVKVQDIPKEIKVDVSELDLNQSICVRDVLLSPGIEVDLPRDLALILVSENKRTAREAQEDTKVEEASDKATP